MSFLDDNVTAYNFDVGTGGILIKVFCNFRKVTLLLLSGFFQWSVQGLFTFAPTQYLKSAILKDST